MKTLRKSMALTLALLMCCALFPTVAAAKTAKKTVYVISEVKVKEGKESTNIKLAYTKDGLLKTIDTTFTDEKLKDSFSYEKGTCRLSKHVSRILSGPHKGDDSESQYTYTKNGLLKSKTDKGDDWKNIITYKYNSEGKIASYNDGNEVTKLSYKKGHVKRAAGSKMTYTAVQDKKGNLKEWSNYFEKEKIGYADNSFTYDKSGRVKKLVRTYKPNPMGNERTQILTYTYTRKTVPADYVKTIKEQQWQYINDVPNRSIVAFGW